MLIQTISMLGLAALVTRGGGGNSELVTPVETGNPPKKVKLKAHMLYNGQPLRTGPDKGGNEFTLAKKSDDAAVLAKSPDGLWAFLWCDSGDGWVPITSLRIEGNADSLPDWSKPMQGYTYKPEGKIDRPTDLKKGWAARYETMVCLPKGQYVKLLAQSPDTFWVFAWSDMGDGWVPRSAIDTKSDLQWLATWHNVFVDAELR